jgi:hypothetical protein
MRGSRVRLQGSFETYGKGHTLFAWMVAQSIRGNVPLSLINRVNSNESFPAEAPPSGTVSSRDRSAAGEVRAGLVLSKVSPPTGASWAVAPS